MQRLPAIGDSVRPAHSADYVQGRSSSMASRAFTSLALAAVTLLSGCSMFRSYDTELQAPGNVSGFTNGEVSNSPRHDAKCGP